MIREKRRGRNTECARSLDEEGWIYIYVCVCVEENGGREK